MIRKKYFITTLIISLILIISGTFAWLFWQSEENTNFTLNIGEVAEVLFNGGNEIKTVGIGPVISEEEGEITEFQILKKIDDLIILEIGFNPSVLPDGLKEESFKYKLYSKNSLEEEETLVTEGNFKDKIEGSTFSVTDKLEVTSKTSYYRFVIYIDGNMLNPSTMKDQTFEGKILVNNKININDMNGIDNVYNFSSSGNYSFVTPVTNNYKIELWGAEGGSTSNYTGGKGAYTKGILALEKGETLYVYVGGRGTVLTGGYNGGGTISSDQSKYGSSGGGSSDVRLIDGNYNDPLSLNSRIIVASGGGGANQRGENYGEGNGGAGGTLVGIDGQSVNHTNNYGYAYGTGGTQLSGGFTNLVLGTGPLDVANGAFGQGGGTETATNLIQSGGGGGYYGGGPSPHGGAGGGSSFISGYTGCIAVTSDDDSTPKSGCTSGTTDKTCSYHYSNKIFVDPVMIPGNENMPSYNDTTVVGNPGDGYVRITLVVPTISNLADKTVILGEEINLSEGLVCVDNGTGCKISDYIIKDSMDNTYNKTSDIMNEGTYDVQYIVTDNNNNGYIYHSKLFVIDSIDNSGANAPLLVDGMIPVKWDSNNTVVKADSTNSSVDYWYSYSDKKWANAVVVTESSRSKYMNASMGTNISEADILAYFVWIPRYKYKLFNASSATGTIPQSIEIVFQSKNAPKENGNTNGTYLTHPAFSYVDSSNKTVEVDGFWIGKFETTGNTTMPTIKPGIASLSLFEQNISNQYASSLKFSSLAYLTDDGVVNSDAHMLKNMEWGAVAYLSHSIYGINNEIASNTTTYAGGGAGNAYLTNTAQSTTNNIYGVYDMSGGGHENVMGNYNNITGGSGLNLSNVPSRYIDIYASTTLGKLGDATGETRGWYSDSSSRFRDESGNARQYWLSRGGHLYKSAMNNGIFNFATTSNGDMLEYSSCSGAEECRERGSGTGVFRVAMW